LVNLVSALTPNDEWRVHLLTLLEPMEAVPLFHALAIPASALLLATGISLAHRRRRAWRLAVALLVVLGAFDLLKGLDVEEALLSWAAAGLLWWGRKSFHVRHDALGLRSVFWRVPLVALAAACGTAALVWIVAPGSPGAAVVLRETGDLLLFSHGPIHFSDELRLLPLAVGLLGVATLLSGAYLLYRPLTAPRKLPDAELRSAARALVRGHGRDTLAFFKLRRDVHYRFSADGSAFAAYRVEGGVLVLAGDPVGPPEAIPQLLRELAQFAELHGLRLGGVGASAGLLPVYRDAGLRSLYIGDEAIVETGRFSLEGRAIRKVRQSVSRLQKAGYSAELRPLDELGASELDELERVAERWRQGAPERGFAMAMDSLRGDGSDSVVLVARDGSGAIRGFLHFVPTYGRAAVSLSFMRRDRDTPNGLIEFLVVRAIELLRERGVEELSLNFAAFARLLHSPSNWLERRVGRLMARLDRFFQIESLYRFNVKFSPRWEPRYLLYQSPIGLPRTGLAVMWVEGQLPKPSRSARRRRDRTGAPRPPAAVA
jgi:lysyl-tRNA synthetase class 2